MMNEISRAFSQRSIEMIKCETSKTQVSVNVCMRSKERSIDTYDTQRIQQMRFLRTLESFYNLLLASRFATFILWTSAMNH